MLNQKGQHLKIITALFSVFVLLLLMAPAVFATNPQNETGSDTIVFTNEFVLNGKRMIMETRIYEAPESLQMTDSAQNNQLFAPANGKLTQGYRPGHYANDIAGTLGSGIMAAGAGKVEKVLTDCEAISVGCGGGYGNHVIIDHGGGLTTMYAHLDAVAVKAGDIVPQGSLIGQMGRSGNVDTDRETHLHFEVRDNGMKKDPADYIGE